MVIWDHWLRTDSDGKKDPKKKKKATQALLIVQGKENCSVSAQSSV